MIIGHDSDNWHELKKLRKEVEKLKIDNSYLNESLKKQRQD